MVTTGIKDVSADKWIAAMAKHLKSTGKVTIPKWSTLAKTATWKEYGPLDDDWLYVRMAAIVRRVYIHKNAGMATFKRIFGGRDRRGVTQEHRALAAGGNIRFCLQALEKMGLVAKDDSTKGGRRITPKGMKECDTVAASIKA